MSALTEFTLASGKTILVEAHDDTPFRGDTAPIARGLGGALRAEKGLSEALSQVREVVDETLTQMNGLDSADEMEICFGVRLSGQMGAMVTKIGAESNLTVRVLWKRSE
ncbi:CU044_2847 family protein [Streptomonospora algeriensis]|uniref:CU044_2847 family protein n=1 Tax=Streptomonospora algeriensis TaxID=995084 RepID=A0ABW3BE07_9ACTN